MIAIFGCTNETINYQDYCDYRTYHDYCDYQDYHNYHDYCIYHDYRNYHDYQDYHNYCVYHDFRDYQGFRAYSYDYLRDYQDYLNPSTMTSVTTRASKPTLTTTCGTIRTTSTSKQHNQCYHLVFSIVDVKIMTTHCASPSLLLHELYLH